MIRRAVDSSKHMVVGVFVLIDLAASFSEILVDADKKKFDKVLERNEMNGTGGRGQPQKE